MQPFVSNSYCYTFALLLRYHSSLLHLADRRSAESQGRGSEEDRPHSLFPAEANSRLARNALITLLFIWLQRCIAWRRCMSLPCCAKKAPSMREERWRCESQPTPRRVSSSAYALSFLCDRLRSGHERSQLLLSFWVVSLATPSQMSTIH